MTSLLSPRMELKLMKAITQLPEHCREGLLDYLRYGTPPGDFLRAVLSNNLKDACRLADEINLQSLSDYVFVLYNNAPVGSWGSPEKVAAWIEVGNLSRPKERVG